MKVPQGAFCVVLDARGLQFMLQLLHEPPEQDPQPLPPEVPATVRPPLWA